MSEQKEEQYSVQLANFSCDKQIILDLWEQGFSYLHGAAAAKKFEAQYLKNPAGIALCFALLHNATQSYVGIQGLLPRQFTHDQVNIRAGLMVDYVVNSAHRSLGPALALLRACIDGGIAKFNFLYGFPNRKAEAIFKRAGFSPLGQMTQYVLLTRTRDFLQKRINHPWLTVTAAIVDFALHVTNGLRVSLHRHKYQWREIDHFDEKFDTLWQQLQPQHKMIAKRAQQSLSWRYPTQSNEYQIFAACERASEKVAGYIVWSQHDDEIIVRDFLAKPATLGPLLLIFSWRMRQHSISRIALEFFGNSQIATILKKSGFSARGELPVFILERPDSVTTGCEQWYMTSFDRDTD